MKFKFDEDSSTYTEEWITSFLDVMTLLLAFFIVLVTLADFVPNKATQQTTPTTTATGYDMDIALGVTSLVAPSFEMLEYEIQKLDKISLNDNAFTFYNRGSKLVLEVYPNDESDSIELSRPLIEVIQGFNGFVDLNYILKTQEIDYARASKFYETSNKQFKNLAKLLKNTPNLSFHTSHEFSEHEDNYIEIVFRYKKYN